MLKTFIGTSGFYYNHWIGTFYPKTLPHDKFLSYYCRYFDTVEINSTFYHLPFAKTIETWRNNTPDNFVFSFKMSRFISHIKRLNPDKDSIKIFLERLQPFTTNKLHHVILIQTPFSLKVDIHRLGLFVPLLSNSFRLAFEFRNQSWFTEEVYKILRQNNCAVVLSDTPKNNDEYRIWPYENVDTANFFYIRFHGSSELYSSSYSDLELKSFASLIKTKISHSQDVYCYFNNDADGHAIKNALSLKKLLNI